MEKHELAQVESQVRRLMSSTAAFGDTSDLDELLKIIHRPGWTTPAELQFLTSGLESLTAQVRQMAAFREALIKAAQAVAAPRAAGA